jgi:putative MATE family efflux protein
MGCVVEGNERMALIKNKTRKRVLTLALPVVMEQAAVMLLGIINTIMVGRLGKEAVSAVGMVDMFSRCIFPLFSGLSAGGTILVAHSIGRGEKEKACEIAKQAIYSGTVIAIIITASIGLAKGPILHLLYGAAEDTVMHYAFTYFKITLLSYPFMFIYYLTNGVLRGSGDTKTPMRVTLIMNCISAVLSYFLIYGINIHGGGVNLSVAGLGVEGAALGISIARIIGAVINIYILLRGNKIIQIRQWNKYRLKIKTVLEVLRLGVPYALEQFSMQTGKLILQIVIIGMGTVAIAANTIGMSIMSLCITLGYGFNLTAVTLVGQALGAGNPQEAEKDTKEVLKINMLFMVVMSAIIIVFAPQLFSLYSNDQEVISCGVELIRIYAFSQPFLAIVQVLSGSLRGGGDTKYPMIATFIGVWLFRLLFGYLLGVLFGMGISGVWIAMTIDLALRALLFIIRYNKGKWKTIMKERETKDELAGYLSSTKE